MAGRKSAASLSVIAGTIDGRPKPPSSLTPFQANVWDRVVSNENADTFRTAALQDLLTLYCHHVEAVDWLENELRAAKKSGQATVADLNALLMMRDRESKAVGDKATKLRLTNQSRYTPQSAGTAAKNTPSERKPWQSVA